MITLTNTIAIDNILLKLHMQQSQQRILIDCTTANQMWTTLTAQHVERAADNQHDLLVRFYEYNHQVGTDMKNHVANIKFIAHQLGEVGRPVDEKELITKIVSTLPVAYRPFVSSWRHVPLERQTLLNLTSLILQEEREISKLTPRSDGNHELAFQAYPSTSSAMRDGYQTHHAHFQKRKKNYIQLNFNKSITHLYDCRERRPYGCPGSFLSSTRWLVPQ